ncbi:MAG: hypothetical protein SNI91_05545 [Rikenellaceae bacterium]
MNKKIKLIIVSVLLSTTIVSTQVSPYESKIDEIMSRMTLEQKVDEIFGTYMVGSILNAPYTTPLSPENWEKLIDRFLTN